MKNSAPVSSASATTAASRLNPKEANDEALAEAVLDMLPHFAVKEGVVAIGELGYDEQTPQEDKCLRLQIELAKDVDLPIMIHTPHRDKHRGTLRTMDVLAEHGFDPARCVIDHNTEETVREVLDRGYFAGFSIYPQTKMGNERLTEIVRQLRAGADHHQFRLRLGRVRSARRAEDRGADGRARHLRRGDPAGHLRQRARGLRPVRIDEGDRLARPSADRSAHLVPRQQRTARRTSAADRCAAIDARSENFLIMSDATIAEPASATTPPRMGLLAEGLDFPTSAAFADDGALYVAESGLPFGGARPGGRIVQIKNDGASQTVLEGLRAPVNGLVWSDGGFYISEGGFPGRISRWTPGGARQTVLDDLPGHGNYHTNMVAVGPDGWLYFSQGAMTNSGVVGLDAYDLAWLKQLPHPFDPPGFDIVLAGKSSRRTIRSHPANKP